MLSKEELTHILFPIGHLQKAEVRAIAKKSALFTSEKKDSQGICFLGDVDMREFLAHYIEQKKGPVVDTAGNIIGEHDGIWFYTLGERHGFRLATQSTDQKPYYVIEKRITDNTLVVSHESKPLKEHGEKQTITLREINWLPARTGLAENITAQIRYHGEFIPANILSEDTVELSYQGVIAEGQSLVLYNEDCLVGGGVIDSIT